MSKANATLSILYCVHQEGHECFEFLVDDEELL